MNSVIVVISSFMTGFVLRPTFDVIFATILKIVTNAMKASKLSSFEKEYNSCAERVNDKVTPEMEGKLFLQKDDNTIWTVVKLIPAGVECKLEFYRCPNEEKKRGF